MAVASLAAAAWCAVWPHDPGVSGTVRSTVPVVFLTARIGGPFGPSRHGFDVPRSVLRG